jgi:putative peptide zinc metalloprotease protein
MTVTARIRILLLALLAVLTLATPLAGAQSNDTQGPQNNQATAEARHAGDSVIDLAFSVRENASEVIDDTNSAVAYASCEACRAVAIAFQIVIVQGDPNTVTPTNVAVAVNNECQGCSTLALAYQFVVGYGEPVEFTEEGLRRLEKIRREFAKLEEEYANLTNEEIQARTDAFAAEIRDILATELVPVDKTSQGNGKRIDRENKAKDDGVTTTTPVQPAPAEPPPATAPPPPPTEPAPTETAPTETVPAPEETEDPTMTTMTP